MEQSRYRGISHKDLQPTQGVIYGSHIPCTTTRKTSDRIKAKSSAKQGWLLSPVLFNIALDWAMNAVKKYRKGITWGLFDTLEDIDHADDICRLSSTFIYRYAREA